MTSKIPELMILKELEDALEERQKSDRRSENIGFDPDSLSDRREGDRRTKAEKSNMKG